MKKSETYTATLRQNTAILRHPEVWKSQTGNLGHGSMLTAADAAADTQNSPTNLQDN